MGPSCLTLSVLLTVLSATAPVSPPDAGPGGHKALPTANDPQGPGAAGADDLHWTAGLGDGVSLQPKDGAWRLDASARIQLRAATTLDPTAEAVDERLAAEFLVRRARLSFGGMVLHDTVRWKVQLGMSQNDVELDRPIIVRDAWLQWNAPLGVGLRVGQMKVPFDRQRQVSSSALQFADRARMISELTLDRDIGLQLFHDALFDKRVVVQAGLFGGDGRNRPTPNSGFLTSLRAQWQPLGAFDDLSEGDLKRHESPRIAVAAAAASSTRSTRVLATTGRVLAKDGSEGLLDAGHGTVDVMFKWQGLSVLGSAIGRVVVDDHDAPEPIARSAVGGVAQVGYLVIGGLEAVGRVAAVEPLAFDGLADNDPTLVREWEASGGFNFYWSGHDLKLNTDVGAIGPEGGPVRAFGRAQVQLQF